MNKEDIIRMAREAGLYTILNEHAHEYGNGYFEITPYPELERFIALAAAAEREACAELCERMARRTEDIRRAALEMAAENIRARGNT